MTTNTCAATATSEVAVSPGRPTVLGGGTRVKHARLNVRQVCADARAALGPLLPFAPSFVQRSRKGRWPGLRSPAPRSRGTVLGPLALRHQRGVLGCRLITPRMGACARTPSHLPRHSGGMRRLCMPLACAAGRWWCPRAQDPFAVSANRCGVNPVLTRLRFALQDGAPRAWAGARGHRHRPGVATLARSSRRTAATGRKLSFPARRRDAHRGSCEARWSK